MKKLILSVGLVVVLASLSLQPLLAAYPITIGISKLRKEDRDVKNFDAVMAGGPITVIVTMGTTEGLRFEGDAEAISTLITEVVSNKLIIRPQNSWTSWAKKYEGKKIVAYVSAKKLKSLAMSGDGSITVKGKVQTNSFATALSGSGYITVSLDVASYSGVISGSGKLNISGTADNASITISGSGSFTKYGLSISSLSTVISGSGSVNVNVDGNINAVISGSGNVNYSGNATVEKRVVGSGRVNKV